MVVLLTEDRYEKALDFVLHHFLQDVPINKALGVEWTREAVVTWVLPIFKFNLSLILVNPENDDIVALLSAFVSKRGFAIDPDAYGDVQLKLKARMLKSIDTQVQFHEHYHVDEAIHFRALAVHGKYRQRGIAKYLVNRHLEFLKQLGISPIYVKTRGSSRYSQRIFEMLGFETLHELKFDDYKVNDKVVIPDTGEHKSIKTYGYKVC